jgi:hypothetical protein
MRMFAVIWGIDVEAETPHEAALEALRIMRYYGANARSLGAAR